MARKNRVRLGLESLETREVPAVFVNEIHYDNAGTNTDELVEIAGTAGTNLSGWSIALYDGTNGLPYFTAALGGVIPNQQNGYGTVVQLLPSEMLHNDLGGIAIVDNMGQVVQFISYEGQFTATGGPAAGLTSQNIGPWEWGTDQPGFSLQLTGTGAEYTDFVWNGATTATPGTLNVGQNFSAPLVPPTPPVILVEQFGDATEGGADGMFRFFRSGDTSQALVVMVSVSGTATPGEDFAYLPSQVNFAAGSSVATVTVAPIDDTVAEPTETVTLTIQSGGTYTVDTLGAATLDIVDKGFPLPRVDGSSNAGGTPGILALPSQVLADRDLLPTYDKAKFNPKTATAAEWQALATTALPYPAPKSVQNYLDNNRAISAFYAGMYKTDSKLFSWAGLAAYASNDIGMGMGKAGVAAEFQVKLDIFGTEAKDLFALLAMGNKAIFESIGWQHLAYHYGGIGAIEANKEAVGSQMVEAWKSIDKGRELTKDGKQKEGEKLISRGTRLLAEYEQKVVLQPIFDKYKPFLKGLTPATVMGGSSLPKAGWLLAYGKFEDVKDRWTWVDDIVLPTWTFYQATEAKAVDTHLQKIIDAVKQ